MRNDIITVDGPSASGKSTVAKRVAAALRYTYADSGAVYRGVTWKAIREGVPPGRPADVVALLRRMDLRFVARDGVAVMQIDGIEPGAELRSEAVSERVSEVAAIPEVRAQVTRHLREIAKFGPLVMDGRDIGSVVFPDAPFKFYIDASPEERARRRHAELLSADPRYDMGRVGDALKRRDAHDTGRAAAPLTIPPGAIVIDTTRMRVEEVVAHIVSRVRESR